MGLPSRRLAWLGAIASLTAGAAFAACGLDENGTMPGTDASIQDVIQDRPVLDVFIETAPPPPPLSCEEAGTALDASCLGEAIPAGWQPVAWQNGAVDCPTDAGFFDVFQQATNPQIPTGACSCSGCVEQGTWSCGATLAGGGACTTDKADSSASFCTNINNHTSFGETITRFGSAACSGGTENGTQQPAADRVSLCFPNSCETDFCRLGSNGYKLCVYNQNVTDGGCPDNVFKVPTVVGGAVAMQCDPCTACTLANPTAACTGTVTAWSNSDCQGNVLGTSSQSDACASTNSNYSSLSWDAGPTPAPLCAGGTNVTTGQIDLVNKGTICCTQ